MGISVSNADSLDVTNRFVLDFAARHGGRVLDYGCGAGRTVRAGRERGLEIYGTDVFYGGSQSRAEASASGLLGDVIREMQDGRIPFPEGSFDLVTNNQVMEHVEDLDAVLREMNRVLRPGGTVLSVFPSVDVWREGHIGIPFSHWFTKGSRIRFFLYVGPSESRNGDVEGGGTDHQTMGDRQTRLDRPLDAIPNTGGDLRELRPAVRERVAGNGLHPLSSARPAEPHA